MDGGTVSAGGYWATSVAEARSGEIGLCVIVRARRHDLRCKKSAVVAPALLADVRLSVPNSPRFFSPCWLPIELVRPAAGGEACIFVPVKKLTAGLSPRARRAGGRRMPGVEDAEGVRWMPSVWQKELACWTMTVS